MASPVGAALCALAAAAFWSWLGHALGRRLLPPALAAGAAPALGWAVFSALALPLFDWIGFSSNAVGGVALCCAAVAGLSFVAPRAKSDAAAAPSIPRLAFAAAAVLALGPTLALLPKLAGDAVWLADPIFDHAKVALIDAMTRQGLPPVDPVFGAAGGPGHLVYYYLWHFSAAALALALRTSGWEADIGLTWFTAFASLTLMMGLAVWLSRRSGAAFCVVLLAAAASLRQVLGAIFGSYELTPFLQQPNGFAGWLFQAAWVPQHLMAATCTVLATVLVQRSVARRNLLLLAALVLVVVAGFESSTYVGGLTFALAAVAAAPILWTTLAPARRLGASVELALAGMLVVLIAAPFIRDQATLVAARGGGAPLLVHPFEVLGDWLPEMPRRALDLPAFWLVLLPIEFPATFAAGVIAFVALLRKAAAGPEKTTTALLAALAAAGLIVSWLVVGTLGDNNDLGLRAVLPAAMVLIVAAAAGLMQSPRRRVIAALALGGLVLSLPDTAKMMRSNILGTPRPDGAVFAQAPDLWAAVRRYVPPSARVANNPLALSDLTPWPVNVGWALLADRSSCFAGREMALAFAPLPAARREAVNAQFVRVFAGEGAAADVHAMAHDYGCDVVVLVAQDKAWSNDPFATSPDYRLAENRDGRWRIYVRR